MGNVVVVRAGLFGGGGKKAAVKEPKKSGGIGGFSFGSKPKAPAKPEKKSGGIGGFSFGSKPKAPAKESCPSQPKFGTKKVGTKKIGTKKVSANSTGSGVDLPFFGNLDATDLVQTGNDRYYKDARKSTKAKGAQRAVGYKGSGEKGSAPDIDAQGVKAKYGGVVYRFSDKYGGNIDEFSPIFTPETRPMSGDVYEPGLLGLAIWAAGFVGLLAVGGYAIYSTSAL